MGALVDKGAALRVRAGGRRRPEGTAEVDRAEAKRRSTGTERCGITSGNLRVGVDIGVGARVRASAVECVARYVVRRDLLVVRGNGRVVRGRVCAEPGDEACGAGGVRGGVGVCSRRVGVGSRRGGHKRGLPGRRAAVVCRALAKRRGRARDGKRAGDLGDVRVLNGRANGDGCARGIDVVEEVGGLDGVAARAGAGEVVGRTD